MYDIYNDDDYAMWCERSTISDCFKKLQYNHLAKMVMKEPANAVIIGQYLTILRTEAKKHINNDVLDCLAINGLLTQGGHYE